MREHYLYRPDGIWAIVQLAPLPNAMHPVSITLLSWNGDGTLLMTLNHRQHTTWPSLPNCSILDVDTPALTDYIATHATRGPFDSPCDIGNVLNRLNILDSQALENAAEDGLLASNSAIAGAFRPTWKGACHMMRQTAAPSSKNSNTQSPTADQSDLSAIVATYGDELERYCRRVRPFRARAISRLLAAGSMIVAAGSFLVWFPLWQVALFMGVLLLHEFGHLLAMRLTGHLEAKIFFLPFLGAATVGQKKDSSNAERVFVALMGSLPGLMLASLSLPWILDGSLLDNQFITIGWTLLVVINWLNLIPVLPLDGGHVLNLIVFSRYPVLESAFRCLSFALLLIVGLWFGQPIVIVPFLVGMLITVSQHKVAVLADDMRREPPATEKLRFHQYARHLLRRYGVTLPFPTALAVIEATEWRKNQKPLPIASSVAFLTIYVSALLLPPLGYWFVFHF
jgi:Zn-dependent protease